MTTSLTHDRFAILTCGTAVLMVLGLIYAWSIFVQPLETEFGWSRSQTSLTFSVSMVLWSCGMLANGQLSKRLPLRVCFALGIGLIACLDLLRQPALAGIPGLRGALRLRHRPVLQPVDVLHVRPFP